METAVKGSVQYNLTWAQAMASYNQGDIDRAVKLFESIDEVEMAVWVQMKKKSQS